MRPRIHSKAFLLVAVLLLDASLACAAPSHILVLSLHGTRAVNGDGPGWGGGGSIRYSVVYGLKLWTCAERVRTASHGSSFVSTTTPWTFGVEVGPRAPRRIQPLFRLGLGMYHVRRRGEFVDFFTGRRVQYSESRVFSGLNFGGGGYARLVGGITLELSATFHQSFSSEFATDGPHLGEVQLGSFRVGLGYRIR